MRSSPIKSSTAAASPTSPLGKPSSVHRIDRRYDVPKVDVRGGGHSRAVTAGSMRGFGALQTLTALEVMIDEAAVSSAGILAFRRATCSRPRQDHGRQRRLRRAAER